MKTINSLCCQHAKDAYKFFVDYESEVQNCEVEFTDDVAMRRRVKEMIIQAEGRCQTPMKLKKANSLYRCRRSIHNCTS